MNLITGDKRQFPFPLKFEFMLMCLLILDRTKEGVLNKKLVQQFMILLCTSIFMVKGTGIVGRANVNHARGYKRLMEAYATLLLGVKLKKKSK